jgi:hypothetical protein
MLFAPFAVFLQLNFPLYLADIFTAPVIVAFAGGALEANKIGLGHAD